ncbi:hypothetical protein DesLBE_1029 [Desulfitobacterium sp. LBE]|uniref:Uncharacterized protein n=3 Tax=root TaxID=1 RepID=A0A098AX05_DESHA|nr:hypothetical protein Dhaf_2332 [Desulfitobacterium hafniense DCB-2]TWH56777.1 hypothetical protein DesLBE_1029 [Desulfitobacterium sp. LBE]CDX01169.1 Hypothetical protein DPCES_1282 [Desulfitobacterium hafniense]
MMAHSKECLDAGCQDLPLTVMVRFNRLKGGRIYVKIAG